LKAENLENIADLLTSFYSGSVKTLAKIITFVENERPERTEILQQLYRRTGHAYVVGITGPPGSGKSTLTGKITLELRKRNLSVGILAVDPSSPFSGGSLMGDRLRMKEISWDEEVFVRSMATRGALGGLARTTADIVKVLDAFGKDIILIETVGVGQVEVDIIKTADCTLLVCVPGLGDHIQALKAGIMEIGDIFVVNKGDHEGADHLCSDISMMLDMSSSKDIRPPILKTIATLGEGVPELTEEILAYRQLLQKDIETSLRRINKAKEEIIDLLIREISTVVQQKIFFDSSFEESIIQIIAREKDPYSYVKLITESFEKYCQDKFSSISNINPTNLK
jgi:LAO/AO transport system kinase